eukprot:scaffold1850_cov194-Pinguiococcus_pyrenoidosus.AAC.4
MTRLLKAVSASATLSRNVEASKLAACQLLRWRSSVSATSLVALPASRAPRVAGGNRGQAANDGVASVLEVDGEVQPHDGDVAGSLGRPGVPEGAEAVGSAGNDTPEHLESQIEEQRPGEQLRDAKHRRSDVPVPPEAAEAEGRVERGEAKAGHDRVDVQHRGAWRRVTPVADQGNANVRPQARPKSPVRTGFRPSLSRSSSTRSLPHSVLLPRSTSHSLPPFSTFSSAGRAPGDRPDK